MNILSFLNFRTLRRTDNLVTKSPAMDVDLGSNTLKKRGELHFLNVEMETLELKIATNWNAGTRNKSSARTMPIGAVTQPRLYYAECYFYFNAEALFTFLGWRRGRLSKRKQYGVSLIVIYVPSGFAARASTLEASCAYQAKTGSLYVPYLCNTTLQTEITWSHCS